MEIEEYLIKMRKIQKAVLELIEADTEKDIKFHDLIELLNNLKIGENCDELKTFFHLIMQISHNHNRKQGFFSYIEKIIFFYKDNIPKYYSNWEIFTIFKNNKRILLFLINSKILTIDYYVLKRMKKAKYINYFFPELKNFLNEGQIAKISPIIPEDLEKKRQSGENESSFICSLIRNDSVQEFIAYVNSSNISLSKTIIQRSIFETNSVLKNMSSLTLIQYAAFFGSIQIFRYLIMNKIELKPSLFLYAIHSNNAEIIHLLEENHIKPYSYLDCYNEAIKCHHNDIANYIKDMYLNDTSISNSLIPLISFNFEYIQKDMINDLAFHDLCKLDYIIPVRMLLQYGNIDINAIKKIYNQI